MLKNFKPIGLMLFAGILCSPESIKADTTPIRPSVNISQQNGKLTGTVEDEFISSSLSRLFSSPGPPLIETTGA